MEEEFKKNLSLKKVWLEKWYNQKRIKDEDSKTCRIASYKNQGVFKSWWGTEEKKDIMSSLENEFIFSQIIIRYFLCRRLFSSCFYSKLRILFYFEETLKNLCLV